MKKIELLLNRQSTPLLTKPAPNQDELSAILNCGMRVPDHGGLTPWHFTVIKDDGLLRLSEIYTQALFSDGAQQSKLDKVAKMPLRAPLIIMISTKYKQHEKVPKQEQLVAAGCSAHAMQMAAFALGYGAMWRTGELSYHAEVKANLNVDENNDIIGFLYIGTSLKTLTNKSRKDFIEYVSYL